MYIVKNTWTLLDCSIDKSELAKQQESPKSWKASSHKPWLPESVAGNVNPDALREADRFSVYGILTVSSFEMFQCQCKASADTTVCSHMFTNVARGDPDLCVRLYQCVQKDMIQPKPWNNQKLGVWRTLPLNVNLRRRHGSGRGYGEERSSAFFLCRCRLCRLCRLCRQHSLCFRSFLLTLHGLCCT